MKEFDEVLKTLIKIRKGCPSDVKRTSDDVLDFLREELAEVELEIKENERENIIEELGDLLWNVLFLIECEKEKHHFKFERVLEKLNNKLIYRHPHVFENSREVTVQEAEEIWMQQKKKEREQNILH